MPDEKSRKILMVVLLVVAVAATSVAVTLWMTRSSGTPTQTAGATTATTLSHSTSNALPATAGAPTATAAQAEVIINERPVTQEQINLLRTQYGAAPPAGRYWYDSRSGLYGMWGREAGGYIRPGHDFGPLPANASNGNTGVFINGRQLNMTEAMYLQQIFGAVYQGRWWLDGQTGNVGQEGNQMPIANIFVALQQSQRNNKSAGGYSYRDSLSGTIAGAENGCAWISVPGSGSAMSSGC